jgi:RNA methyltransferase, TrmH family
VIITSAANSRLKALREAFREGQGDPEGRVPIEGVKLLQEAIKSRLRIEEIFVAQSRRHEPMIKDLLAQIEASEPDVVEVSDRAFSSVSTTESPQGLLALAKLPQVKLKMVLEGSPLLLLAFELQDPGNLGTLLRSADAFGVEGVLLSRNSVSPLNPKVIRASAGSLFRIPCLGGFELHELLAVLSQHGFELLAMTPRATTDFRNVAYRGKVALLVGNESRGLNDEIFNRALTRIQIPMRDSVESLNAAISVSIVLCEAARQRALPIAD